MSDAFALPPLRQELRLEPGAPLASGAPGFILFDPLRHAFFQLGRIEQRVVAWWHAGEAQAVLDALVAEGEEPVAAEDAIVAFHEFALANSLTRDLPGDGVAGLAARARAAKRDGWHWLLDHYLFIRIPLVRPAAFLERTLPHARRLWSRAGVTVLAAMALVGLLLISREWDAFAATFPTLVAGHGLFAYAGALLLVKLCHELGHAWVATRHGVRVSTMGVSFLVMVPVLYTDTSGAWRLRSRRHRMQIDSAGILAELSVAAVALFAWPWLPDGAWRTGAFVLATTSLAATLLVNASPFMRYDGYYLLSDWLRIPNLAPRAFAIMRWRLRETLFDLREPAPEELPTALRRTLIGYAAITFAYRASLYIGIALLVYHSFFKALGLALFIVEVSVFLARPLVAEARQWAARWPAIRASRRARLTAAATALAIVLAFLPLDRSVSLPAVLAPIGDAPLVAGDPARVEQVLVRSGDPVAAGQPLIRLSSPDLVLAAAQARLRIAQLDSQLARAGADREDMANAAVLARDLAAEQDRLAGLDRRLAALTLRAPIAGRVVDVLDGLTPGMWTDGKAPLARVVTPGRWDVVAYLPENDLWRVGDGGSVGRFVSDDATAASWRVRLDEIGSGAVKTLDQPALAQVNGGAIATEPATARGALVPTHALIALHLVAEARDGSALPQPMAGVVTLPARGESLAARVARGITRVFVREASLM